MFFNLFSLVIIYIFFFILILSAGKIANNHILQFKNLSLGEHGLIGFIFLYFLTLCFHFFFPINNFLTSLIFIFLITLFIKNFKEIRKIKRISNLNLVIIFLFFYYYQLQTIITTIYIYFNFQLLIICRIIRLFLV